MKKKKVIALLSAAIVLCVIGGVGYATVNGSGDGFSFLGGTRAEDKVYVEKLSKVMKQSTGISNRYNGVVESQNAYEVNADSSRTIKEIHVKVGDVVEEGTVLATYDTSEVEMQIKLAELDLEGLQADIDGYNKQIENLQWEMSQTFDEEEQFACTTEIQSIQNSITQTELDIESKNLEIEKYREQLTDASLVSKYSGTVKEINESGMNSTGDFSAFMKILQSGEYRVKGTVDEQNVWMIEEGHPIIIRSRVDETKTWTGKLSALDTNNIESNENEDYYGDGETESATKYPFYVELDSAEGLLLGQHVYIEMDEGQGEVKEGVWLYSDYIVQEEGGAYVWAATKNNKLEKRAVTLGEFDEALMEYEIVSGLTEDDSIAWPMAGLYEGVTTVTNMEEVDYSSPLYNQDSTEEYLEEMMDTEYYFEDIMGTEEMGEDAERERLERERQQLERQEIEEFEMQDAEDSDMDEADDFDMDEDVEDAEE